MTRLSFLLVLLIGFAATVAFAQVEEPQPSPLGIGFLWTAQSQGVAGRLDSERDFVDIVTDEGKLLAFDKLKPAVRIACISLALETNPGRPFRGIKETIELLQRRQIDSRRVIIAYNPERSPGTTEAELDSLVESVKKAKEMADAYGAPLLVGPGLREMLQRETLYPELAKHCDMWLIQSQRLQLDAQTRKPVDVAEYRAAVERIVKMLRQGNPDIKVIVQIVTTAERGTTVLTAEQIAANARSIEDLVYAVRIYGASSELLTQVIDQLRGKKQGALE